MLFPIIQRQETWESSLEPGRCSSPIQRKGISTAVFLVFFLYTLSWSTLALCAPVVLFMLTRLFCMIFCVVGTGVEVIPMVQKIRQWVLQSSSQACIVAADS